jgi:heme-degrading monooxygenase HmoA
MMMLRIWHWAVPKDKADDYGNYLVTVGIPDYRAIGGNRGVYVLRRPQTDRVEFMLLSLWDSFDAIKEYAGDDAEKPKYYQTDREYLIELRPRVGHYEVIGASTLEAISTQTATTK